MKEHPILLSAPMVNAIFQGQKTQTRRIAKPRRKSSLLDGTWTDSYVLDDGNRDLLMEDCPFGRVGDRLWVRETFAEIGCIGWPIDKFEYAYRADFAHNGGNWEGNADMCFEKWKPSIFMPRSASRIALEITDIRVERLQKISEADAIAEGIEPIVGPDGETYYGNYAKEDIGIYLPPIESYRTLWQSINGSESWANNPFVWVISFIRL